MVEKDTIGGVWRGAFAIIGRYPLTTLAPAAVLGAIAEAPAPLIDGRHLLEDVLTLTIGYVAYYLYLAYAEGIVEDVEQGTDRARSWGIRRELLRAAPFLPPVLVAALITLPLIGVATLLLFIPGVWLCTRWSLGTPVICKENLGALAAIRRSNELVRGRFWFVLLTATAAFFLEGTVIQAGGELALMATGSHEWGEWIGSTAVAMLAMPLAAFATSLAHSSLTRPD